MNHAWIVICLYQVATTFETHKQWQSSDMFASNSVVCVFSHGNLDVVFLLEIGLESR